MKRILIVAHVPSTNTRRLADSALAGARHPDIEGVETTLRSPLETTPSDVLGCDGVLIGTTENFGSVAGLTKDFFERVYYPCLENTQGLPWALWVRAGNDGAGARESVERMVTGLRWKAIRPALILTGEWQDRFVDECAELGTTMAAGLEAGVF